MRFKLAVLVMAVALPALPAAAAELGLRDLMSIKQACSNDIKTLCTGIDRGKGRIAQCMMAHADAVSPACSEVLKSEKAKLQPDDKEPG